MLDLIQQLLIRCIALRHFVHRSGFLFSRYGDLAYDVYLIGY